MLRYNNSMSYAADVLSWSAVYRTGGTPSRAVIAPEQLSSTAPGRTDSAVVAVADSTESPLPLEPMVSTAVPQRQIPPLVKVPGLPPISCGILCDGPDNHSEPEAEPAQDIPDQSAGDQQPRRSDQPPELTAPDGSGPSPSAPSPHQPSITLPFGIEVPLPMAPT